MLTIPEHDIFFRLDHVVHEPGSAAAAAVMGIERTWWLNTDQMVRAVDTGSIWTANWMTRWPAEGRAHAAADIEVLVEAIAPTIAPRPAVPLIAPILSDLVNGIRVAVSCSKEIESTARAEALRAIAKLERIVSIASAPGPPNGDAKTLSR